MKTQLLQVRVPKFRSQITCPVSLETVKPHCPQGLLLGLNKFLLFKRCPLHLQLFPCVEKASSTSLTRHLMEQTNTKPPWGGGRCGYMKCRNKVSAHLNTYFHEPQRGSLPLRSWPLHTARLYLITRFESDTWEQVTGQNNHIDFLRVPKDLNHRTHTQSSDHFWWLPVSTEQHKNSSHIFHTAMRYLHSRRTNYYHTSRSYFSTDFRAGYHT